MSVIVPVITLWQPYASLAIARVKIHETRSFAPPAKHVGKRIGIHAAQRFLPLRLTSPELHELCIDTFGCSYNYTLPRGMILGTVVLGAGISTEVAQPHDDDDRIAGDWSPCRYAWPLSDVHELRDYRPAKGKQGWWSYDTGEDGPQLGSQARAAL